MTSETTRDRTGRVLGGRVTAPATGAVRRARPEPRPRLALALAVTLAVTMASACELLPEDVATVSTTTVSRVIDGDTIEVSGGAVVRLLGIDAPETGTCGAEAVTERLAQLLPFGTAVTVVPDPVSDATDRYGRQLAYVELPDGADVGATLVAEGLAGVWWPSSEPMPGRASDYQASADQARASAVGSWSTCDQLGRS